MKRMGIALGCVALLCLAGCATAPAGALRIGSYNIRYSAGDLETPNAWDCRKADLVALVKRLDLDVFGLQEVCPDQAEYLREKLHEFEFVGEHRDADRVSGEASPVFYRKSRFQPLKSGTFWLSETPDVPGQRGWGAACPRVCTYLILRDKSDDRVFCFANTHTDHVSEKARTEGMKLIIGDRRVPGTSDRLVGDIVRGGNGLSLRLTFP